MPSLEDTITRIIELRKSGFDEHGIAQALNILSWCVLDYEEYARSGIERVISDGATNLKEIAAEVKISPATIQAFVSYYGIKLPRRALYKSRQEAIRAEIKNMVGEGLTLREMGDKVGIVKEGVRLYLIRRGLYDAWIESKKRKKIERKDTAQKLVDILALRINALIQDLPWAHQKAIQYQHQILLGKYLKLPYETLVALFERYYQARNNDKKLSLRELCDGLSISFGNAGRILKEVGEEPMYGINIKHPAPKEKKEAIKRGYGLKMSATDIAYFLGVSPPLVIQAFIRIGTGHKFEFLGYKNEKRLSYMLASQIYEAHDLNFTGVEIAQLLGIGRAVVEHAIMKRSDYEPRIIKELRILCANDAINKPYLSKN